MRVATALLLLAAALPARAQQRSLSPPPPPPRAPSELSPPPPPPPAPEPARPSAPPAPAAAATPATPATAAAGDGDADPLLGVMLDAGFPDGLGASLLYRPIWFTRLQGGLTYNFLGAGLRIGGTLVPFHFPITPTLSGEYGHTFDADASGLVARLGTVTPEEKVLLKSVGYDYLTLQLGLETGSPRRFAWFFRGGLSWIWPRVGNVQAALPPGSPITQVSNPRIRVAAPSVSCGMYLFVW